VRRRTFLLGGAVVVVGGAGGFLSIRGWRRSPESEDAADAVALDEVAPAPLFSPEDRDLLLTIADIIVPRDGDLPAASEIDILPKLERWARSSESRLTIYETGWPRLRALLEKKGEIGGAGPSDRTLRRLHLQYRFKRRPRGESVFFEQLRRDVLRLYYASPEGWKAVSYTGPVHRRNPLDEERA
jgi:hypothetical protein